MSCTTCSQILDAASKLTPCECQPTERIFTCIRHRCSKTADYAKLCRQNIGYFHQWHTGAGGPCLNFGTVAAGFGIGDAAEWLIAKVIRDETRRTNFGIRFDRFIEWASRGKFKANNDGTCNCPTRRTWLNHYQLWPIRWPRGKR